MVDIQHSATIMGGREVSRPYQVWFFAEGERFLSFWRCHRPRWGGRRWWCGWFKPQPQFTNQRDGSFGLWFMWFAWNQPCHSTNDKCEALASLKGCFLCFCFSPPVFFHWTASFACMELTVISRFQRLIKNWFGLFLRFFYGCWWSKCLIFNSIITHCAKIW